MTTTRTPSASRITPKRHHHAGRRGALALPSEPVQDKHRAKDADCLEGDAGQVVVDVAANRVMARCGWVFANRRLVTA